MSRPYFETEIVKVKKCKHKKVDFCGNFIKCCKCGYIMTMNDGEPKLKGNWVNGENLDKIKFPVPCSYVDEDKKKHIGMLNCYVNQYRLYVLEKQSNDNFVDDCTSLKNLIREYDIHILKGKIIIYEEEK